MIWQAILKTDRLRNFIFSPHLFSFAGLTGLFLLFHFEVIFQSKFYFNLWIFKNQLPFKDLFPNIYNSLNQNSDFITHHLANKYFIAQSLREGTLPLWNPHVFSGFPQFANGASILFSPWSLLYATLPFFTAYKLQWGLTFLIGGILFYFFVSRCLRLRPFPCFLGTCVYLFCPFLAENADIDSILGFLWVYPAVLILVERYFKAYEFKYMIWLAVVLSLSSYATHIHVAFNAIVLFFIYGGSKWYGSQAERLNKRFWGHFFLSGIIFLGLSAASLMPFIEFLFHSQRGLIEGRSGSLLLPVELLSVLYPIILKIPYMNQIVSFLFSTPVMLHARGVYLGALPVLLAAIGIWVGIRTRFGKNGIFALLVLLYFIFNIIPISRIHPFFDLLTARYWTIYLFCLSVLSAVVLDFLFGSFHLEKLRSVTRALLFFIILPITFLSLLVSLFRLQIVDYALSQTGKISGIMGRDLLQGDVRLRISENLGDLFNLISIGSPFILIPLFVILGFYCLLRFREKISLYWQGMIIFLFLLIDCFVVGWKFRPTAVSQKELFKESSIISFLKKGEGVCRFASLQGQDILLKPNLGIFYGLYDAGGQESLLDRRYLVFSRRALQKKMGDAVTGSGILDFKDIDLKLAGMLHVKYLLQSERDFLFGNVKPVFRAEGIKIYENPYLLPKAFFVQNYRVIKEEEELLKALTDPEFDPKKELLFEEEPLQKSGRRRRDFDGNSSLVHYLPNEIELITDSKEEAYLVLSDTYYPGWKAYVDGKEEKIYRANGVLRAIFVPGGKHTVQFLYRPKTLVIGGLLSIIMLVFVFGALANFNLSAPEFGDMGKKP